MSDQGKSLPGPRVFLLAGVSVIALAVCFERSTGQTSEIDSYDAAVTSQSKTEALNFIKSFHSSHLVGDLIQSLRPEVAQQVCADLDGGGPARARKACEALPKAVAVQPVVPPAEIAPAAGSATVSPVPMGAVTSAGNPPDELQGVRGADAKDEAGTTDFVLPPVTAMEPAAGGVAASPVSTTEDGSASAPSDSETESGRSLDHTEQVGGTEVPYPPVVAAAPGAGTTDAVSVHEDRPGSASSDSETESGRVSDTTDQVGGPEVLYLPVIATVPAAGAANPVVAPEDGPAAAPSNDGPESGTGDTDKLVTNVLLPASRTPSTSVTAAAVSSGTPAPTDVPSGDEPESVTTSTGSGTDANASSSQSSAPSDSGVQSDSGTAADNGAQSDSGSQSDSGAQSDSGGGSQSDSGAESDSGAQSDSGGGSQSDSGGGSQSDGGGSQSDSGGGSQSDSGGGSQSDSGGGAQSDSGGGAQSDSGAQTDSGAQSDSGAQTSDGQSSKDKGGKEKGGKDKGNGKGGNGKGGGKG